MKLYGGASRNRKRSIAALIAIVLIFCASVGGTIAYLVTNTQEVTNTFTPSDVEIKINEKKTDDGETKTSITIENVEDAAKEDIPCYIRVKLVSNMQDKDGNVLDSADVPEFTLNTADWIKGDNGYYYYKHVVNVGASTNNLIAADSKMTLANGQAVEVLAEAIQSVPTSAVKEAWPAVKVGANNQLVLASSEGGAES